MSNAEQTFDLLERTGTNWTVNKLPLTGPDGQKTESSGIFRNDNGLWLGTVGKRYEPMQNHVLAQTMIDACEGVGITATTGGTLHAGGKVYYQAALPDTMIANSGLKRYITLLNTHDGTRAIAVGSASTNVICTNTFAKAHKDSGMTKIVHATTALQRVKAAMDGLRTAMAADEVLMDHFRRMADTKLTDHIGMDLIAKVLKRGFKIDDTNDISTRRKNQLIDLNACINLETGRQGLTLWGLFNGFTHYTNHKQAKPADAFENVMDGAGARLNDVAFDTIMEWMDEHMDKVYVMA